MDEGEAGGRVRVKERFVPCVEANEGGKEGECGGGEVHDVVGEGLRRDEGEGRGGRGKLRIGGCGRAG